MPWCIFCIGGGYHSVICFSIFPPKPVRFGIHRTQFPVPGRPFTRRVIIFDPSDESWTIIPKEEIPWVGGAAVGVDSKNRKWFATRLDGFYMYDEEQDIWRNFNKGNSALEDDRFMYDERYSGYPQFDIVYPFFIDGDDRLLFYNYIEPHSSVNKNLGIKILILKRIGSIMYLIKTYQVNIMESIILIKMKGMFGLFHTWKKLYIFDRYTGFWHKFKNLDFTPLNIIFDNRKNGWMGFLSDFLKMHRMV